MVAALSSGLLLALSFPLPGIALLAWVAFVPLLVACNGASPRQAFRLGMVAGLTAYAGILYWLNIVMTTYGRAKELGVEPIGELLSWGVAGVDPHYMGIGPVPAALIALNRAGMELNDISHFEINEAFAGQYLAVERELNLDRSKVNVNGGAIALGHPLGATGARLTISLLKQGGIGLASACIGGGQGGALIVEGFC